MRDRIVPVVLLLLLVGTSSIAVYEYMANLELTDKNRRLQDELEQAAQVKRATYIAVGLAFVWSRSLDIKVDALREAVELMNDVQWDRFGVYFFISHAGSFDMPLSDRSCKQSAPGPWTENARNLYPERDILVGIFVDLGDDYYGCTYKRSIIEIGLYYTEYPRPYAKVFAATLTHELLHVFGFSEQELSSQATLDWVIPLDWRARIQEAATQFRTTPPPETND